MKRGKSCTVVAFGVVLAACSAAPDLEHPGDQTSGLTKGTPGALNGDVDFCSDPLHRCDKGEGDCDSNAQCLSPLVCGTDNGPAFGMKVGYDVCVPAHCVDGIMDADETGFDCGGADCGICSCPSNGTATTCSVVNGPCRCHSGWGDCDSDANCVPGLVCGTDLGAQFGMPAGYDVCVPPHCTNGLMDADETGFDCGGADCGTCPCPANGTATSCSKLTGPCLCHAGWGDCDSDANCRAGLVCGTDIGAQFGMPSGYDVCVPPHCVNGIRDADETRKDCGGVDCGSCPACAASGPVDCATTCTCGATQYCDTATSTCKPRICTPNLPACNGNNATTCNADGSGYVSDGTSCTTLVCIDGTCQAGLFVEDWEDGSFDGWLAGNDTYARNVTAVQAANGTLRSLVQTGGAGLHQQGLYRTFPNLKPTNISWWVFPTTTSAYSGYFVLTSGSTSSYLMYAYFGEGGWLFTATAGTTSFVANEWYHLEMRNISWSAHTFDWYVNDTLVAASRPFSSPVNDVTRVDLYNFSLSTAYWDEITFR